MTQTILIVDDDPVQRRLLEGAATRLGYLAISVDGGEAALAVLNEREPASLGAVVLDLMMPGMDGLGVMNAMQETGIGVPVIVQTAQGGIETVVKAMRAGAFDFVVKPVSPDRLKTALENALKIGSIETVKRKATRKVPGSISFPDIVTLSPVMTSVLKIAEKAAQSQIPVLIEGESGVGKELVARAIQNASDRSAKPFVAVNCGALPENLVESILFGHEKGAFTGASEKHVGKFEEANGGTLFLDEIGELPLDIQVKLLRAIQEGEIDPIGARKPVKVNIRLVSATNRNLAEEVSKGRFREDLYYRLSVLPLSIPPLRARKEDVPLLVRHFIGRIGAEENKTQIRGIDASAEALLCNYDWPGNIRQLENAIFRAMVLADGELLSAQEFPQIAAQLPGFELPALPQPVPSTPAAQHLAPSMETPAIPAAASRDAGLLAMRNETGDIRPMEEMEAELIRYAIELYDGRMSKVARKLGIGRSTLYRKLKDLGLETSSDTNG
ncbi:MAG: sigma-54-dependent Fis family transcriptional regulator [Nitratireductor sp.]|nr:sigma-54-dependent Fis family transcriptional regulator [Nitratireductor sp.]